MRFKFLQKETLEKIPKKIGVYCFKSTNEILYIGKARNLRERIKNHFQNPGRKNYFFLDKVKEIGYIKTDSEIEALILEAKLIKKLKPKFNIVWRDDKNYFFVGKTIEDFPRVFWTHQKKQNLGKTKLKVEYAGPFIEGRALKQTLKILRKVFPFRSCLKIPSRPCLWYHLGYCPAPCLLRSKFFEEIKDVSTIKKISQKNAENVFEILNEGKSLILKKLKKEMQNFAKKQSFEEAALVRDQIKKLEKILANAKVLEEIKTSSSWPKTENLLKKLFKLKKRIFRIEAFDVSNIQGKLATGSMVTFIEGLPEKNLYRRFKIKNETKPNDISMLKEVLQRRFSHKEWGVPDLILIDGGKAQLNTAISCKLKFSDFRPILITALAKKENLLFVEGKDRPFFLEKLERELFNLFLKIRDEAHRFAISYHKKLRKKNLLDNN